jgi:hypothetical protein
MATVDAATLLGVAVGVTGTVVGFAAKYAFDFRLAKRRLELDERGAVASTLGGRPGQLNRSSLRMKDRVDGFFGDSALLSSSWLAPAPTPPDDGYFLRSSVQRLFAFVSWASLLQQAIDALPFETVLARRDLQRQYALIDLAFRVLSSIGMFTDYPNYVKDRDGYHLFTGSLDELADLGVAAYNAHSQTIPTSVFLEAYQGPKREQALLKVRGWLGTIATDNERAPVILARFACLGAILEDLIRPMGWTPFAGRDQLYSRLTELEPSARGYNLAGRLPAFLDAELATAMSKWTTAESGWVAARPASVWHRKPRRQDESLTD